MRKFVIGCLFLLVFSCSTDGPIGITSEVVNEEMINSFKNEVLDSLIGQDLLVDYPPPMGIFIADKFIDFDSVYFDQYLSDIKGFRWTGLEIIPYKELELRRKYQREIAMEYNVSVMTLNRWLQKHGIEVERGYIAGAKQLEIYEALGWPECFLKLSA